jgi:hypothetical protein
MKFDRIECRSRKETKLSWTLKKIHSNTVIFFYGVNKENVDCSLQQHFVIERKEEMCPNELNMNPAVLFCSGTQVFINEEKLVKGQSRILLHQDVIQLKSLRKKFTFLDWRSNDLTKYSYEVQSDFYIEKPIGAEGINGMVRLAHDARTLEKFALKTVEFWIEVERNGETRREENIEMARSEIEMMRRVNHPNLVKLAKTVWDPERVHLFVEFMDVGDLFHFVIKPPLFRMAEDEVKFAVYQIVEGLKYLHARNIAHRDIKLENIFMKRCNGELIYKIGDFGLTVFDENLTKKEGTLAFAAPEIFDPEEVEISGRQCDMWSLGVLIYACISGQYPFDPLHDSVQR